MWRSSISAARTGRLCKSQAGHAWLVQSPFSDHSSKSARLPSHAIKLSVSVPCASRPDRPSISFPSFDCYLQLPAPQVQVPSTWQFRNRNIFSNVILPVSSSNGWLSAGTEWVLCEPCPSAFTCHFIDVHRLWSENTIEDKHTSLNVNAGSQISAKHQHPFNIRAPTVSNWIEYTLLLRLYRVFCRGRSFLSRPC